MAAIDLQVASTTDSVNTGLEVGYAFRIFGTYNPMVGCYNTASETKKGMALRLLNAPIPPTATITVAYFSVRRIGSQSTTTVNSRITGALELNPATFEDSATWRNRRGTIVGGANNDYITTQQVAWDSIESFVDGWYNSPDITDIIQEIIEQVGWAMGNSIALYWDDHDARGTQTTGVYRAIYGYSDYSPYAPKLHIEYTVPPAAPTIITQKTTQVEDTTAVGNGNIILSYPNSTIRGVCYSDENNPPTTADDKVEEEGTFSSGVFHEPITGLATETTYYLRAYATNTEGTTYGAVSQFTTLAVPRPDYKIMPIWGHYYNVLITEAERTRFLDICEAENCNMVWMQTDEWYTLKFLTNDISVPANCFQTFIADAKSRGIETMLMIAGSTAKLADPSVDEPLIQAVLKYNQDNPTVKIVGMFWDIEPIGSSGFIGFRQYIDALETYSYNDDTILTQDWLLTAYLDGYDNAGWRDFIHELDYVSINSYGDGLTTGGEEGHGVVGKAATAVAVCEDEEVPFIIGLETDKLAADHNEYTLYEEGHAACLQLLADIEEYYTETEPAVYYKGWYENAYQGSITHWYEITDSTMPTGSFQRGEVVQASIDLKNSDYYQTSARGLELQIRDPNENVWTVGKIIVIDQLEALSDIPLVWTIPDEAPAGDYDARVVYYDIDQRAAKRNQLYYNYSSQYGSPADIEDLSLDDYSAIVTAHPTVWGSVGRIKDDFILLQATDWEEDTFTVTGEEPPPNTPAAAVGLKLILL